MSAETTSTLIQLLYLAASVLFILGLRGLGNAATARRGVQLAEVGMLLAVIGTLMRHEIISYTWIIVGLVLGSLIGTVMAISIPMTKMPERIALSHAFGGLAVALVGISEYWHHQHVGEAMNNLQITATGFEVLFGAVTFTGSLMAFGKLQGLLPGAPMTFPGQNALNALFVVAALGLVGVVIASQDTQLAFWGLCGLGLLMGVTLVLPIGGADMPVVICLLNSYAGLAAAATGFALKNNVLIICGALDGGSGFLLGMMMSKAMNRSFSNVLFGAFGKVADSGPKKAGTASGPAPNEGSIDDAVEILGSAQKVIVIPGYGLAVSQAQHAVKDLANVLQKKGVDVKYAIHPVAGRMPGHMNVLLAEAQVPYEQLFDLDQINDEFASTDVALVVGANDVVNTAAREDPKSSIYGMPVFNVDQAKSCIVLKRSLNPGFAGIENALFVKPHTMLVLGDAKKTLLNFVQGLKEPGGH
ncbi:MAG: NAD(P)(+) transhydrogenase (Re/Si-specific) subunit beta [Archangiaceae bacterium]|nr:NAD(P)(+) transhydrogenase (Re/Si-specific) subunit beta [Archangiaceae bacterium]